MCLYLLDDDRAAHLDGALDLLLELAVVLLEDRQTATLVELLLQPGDALHLRINEQAESLGLLNDQGIVD